MNDRAPTGTVQTVLGPISPDRLGVTLTHEHLLIDLASLRKPPTEAGAKRRYDQRLSMKNLGYVRHHRAGVADNHRLMDVRTAIDEAKLYRQYGGRSLVDATSIGIARDPVSLARISRAADINIVMGASYYVDVAHPPDMDARSEDDLVSQIVGDFTDGVDGTGIKSGIIGEVGCTWPLTDNERKALRASARAQRLTGAPILIHPGRDETAPLEILDILSSAGADLGRTIMGHLDRTVFLKSTLKQMAETGCYLEWDLFGTERSYYPLNPKIDMPSDAKRMDDIAWIISEGYGDRVVVAQDICAKERLIKYGGHGYFYIVTEIAPRMRARGYSEEAVQRILVDNPAAVLTLVEPERA